MDGLDKSTKRDKGTMGQKGKGQWDKGTMGQRDKGTKGQWDKGTRGPRDLGTMYIVYSVKCKV